MSVTNEEIARLELESRIEWHFGANFYPVIPPDEFVALCADVVERTNELIADGVFEDFALEERYPMPAITDEDGNTGYITFNGSDTATGGEIVEHFHIAELIDWQSY